MKSKTLSITQNTLKFLQDQNKSGKLSNTLLQTATDLYSDINNSANDLESIKSMENDLQAELNKALEAGNKELAQHYELAKDILETKRKEVKHIQESEEAMDGLDELTGGFLKKALEFKNASPIAVGLAAAAVLMSKLKQGMEDFAKVADSIGQAFGAYGLQEFGPQLGMAQAKAKLFGFEVDDVNNTVKTLNSNFGFTIEQSTKLVGTITNMSRALGISVEDSATLISMFGKMSGNTNETAEGIISTVEELARIEGVAPNAVLQDIAQNGEFFAKFSKEGGRNVAETALQARKLGLSLSTVEGMMSGATDIAGSLTKEYEAELFLNKDINVDRLRFLKINGTADEILAEQRKILEDINFLGIEDRLTREKIAALLDSDVQSLVKIASAQEESVNLQKQLRELTFKELIGTDAQDGLTNFNNGLATMGAILTQNIIKPISFVVGLFGKLVELLAQSEIGMAALTGTATALAGVMGILAFKGIKMAISMAFAAAAKLGVSTMGFGLAGGLITAGLFVTGLLASLAQAGSRAELAEGGIVKPVPGGVPATIGEGGEAEAVIPLSKMGSLVTVDTSPMSKEIATLKGEIAKTNQAMNTLISNMESYFGFGGSAVKGIGRETIKAGTSLM